MAIRPIKSLSELKDVPNPKLFKNCREINQSNLFGTLLMTGLEHLLTYCRGQNIKQFFGYVLSQIPAAQTDEFIQTYQECFEDLEDLFAKKQLKILNSMIYDYDFLNFLFTLQDLFEVSNFRSSQNEDLQLIEYYSNKMKISTTVYISKTERHKFIAADPFVNITIFQSNSDMYILYPIEYKVYQRLSILHIDEESDKEDMRKNNIQEEVEDEVDEGGSYYSEQVRIVSPGTRSLAKAKSPDVIRRSRELEIEQRMRRRSKVLKEKRKQTSDLRKSPGLRQATVEIETESFNDNAVMTRGFSTGIISPKYASQKEYSSKNEVIPEEDFSDIIAQEKQLSDLLKQKQEETEKMKTSKRLEAEKRLKEIENLKNEVAKKEETRKAEELRLAEERKVLDAKRTEIEKRIEEKRRNFETRKAEESLKLAEQKIELEGQRYEIEKKIQEQRAYAEQLLSERKIPENQRLSEIKKLAEDKRLAAEKRLARINLMYEERKAAEEYRMLKEREREDSRKSLRDMSHSRKKSILSEKLQNTEKKIEQLQEEIQRRTEEKENSLRAEQLFKNENSLKEEERIESLKKLVQEREEQMSLELSQSKEREVEEFDRGAENIKPAPKLTKGNPKSILRSSRPEPKKQEENLSTVAKSAVNEVLSEILKAEDDRLAEEDRITSEVKLSQERLEEEYRQKNEEKESALSQINELEKRLDENIIEEGKDLEEIKIQENKLVQERKKLDEEEREFDQKIEEENQQIIEEQIQEELKTNEKEFQIEQEIEKDIHDAQLKHMVDLVHQGGVKLSIAEQRRLSANETLQRELKKAEERRLAEAKKLEEEYEQILKEREAKRKSVRAKQEEDLRLLEERKQEKLSLQDQKKAELHKANEEKRKIEEKQLEDLKKKEKEKQDKIKQQEEEKLRLEAEKIRVEEEREKRKEEERKAAEKRKEEEKKIAAEKQRKIEEEKRRVEEEKRKAEQKRLIEEQKKQTKEPEETYEETDNTSFCGGVYCAKCSRELKRSNYVLKCDVCNDKYLRTRAPPANNPAVRVPDCKNCMNCGVKVAKGEEVHCIRCFLQIKIFGETASACSGCVRTDQCYWIDAGDGDAKDMTRCGFCDENKHKEIVIKICAKCGDKICLICLRKNPYVTQGVCSQCHNRREPALA